MESENVQGNSDILVSEQTLITIEDLVTEIKTSNGVVRAVDHVSLEIRRGEILGLVGESGSGKTMTALSIMSLLPEPNGEIINGSIIFEGQDLVRADQDELRDVRGAKISIVFQDSMAALNPIMPIGYQITEAVRAHKKVDKENAVKAAIELLEQVGIPDPYTRLAQYPFQMSGGMRQRVMIAIALAGNPHLLIADEPTTNLDVSIQAQILELIRSIRDKTGAAVLLITHNLGIVSWLCDRVAVMYAGEIVESGTTDAILASPKHPYTQLLIKAIPHVSSQRAALETIPGDVPSLINKPKGCSFAPRCPFVRDVCSKVHPSLLSVGVEKQVARCLIYNPTYSENWRRE
jgi:peptide/nickel transport system ATP-binding protein